MVENDFGFVQPWDEWVLTAVMCARCVPDTDAPANASGKQTSAMGRPVPVTAIEVTVLGPDQPQMAAMDRVGVQVRAWCRGHVEVTSLALKGVTSDVLQRRPPPGLVERGLRTNSGRTGRLSRRPRNGIPGHCWWGLEMHGGVKVYRGSPAAAHSYVEAGRGRADDYYLSEGTGVAARYTATPEEGVRPAGQDPFPHSFATFATEVGRGPGSTEGEPL